MKRDPTYKDSRVEWIGEIPEGWEVRKLKYMSLTMKQDKSFNPARVSLFSPNAVVLCTDDVSDYINSFSSPISVASRILFNIIAFLVTEYMNIRSYRLTWYYNEILKARKKVAYHPYSR